MSADVHQWLLDRQAIADALATYCARLDEYDIPSVAALFTADCVTDFGPGAGGQIQGRDALEERITRSQARFERTHHQLGQSLVTIEGERATALTYTTAWHREWDGTEHTLWLRYDDMLIRTDAGWRIETRHVHVSGVQGFEGIPWRYVSRNEPGF